MKDAKAQCRYILNSMLNGTALYSVAALELLELRDELCCYANDPDFLPFVAIANAAHQLELGFPDTSPQTNKHNYQRELNALETWAKELAHSHCLTLLKRYRAP